MIVTSDMKVLKQHYAIVSISKFHLNRLTSFSVKLKTKSTESKCQTRAQHTIID